MLAVLSAACSDPSALESAGDGGTEEALGPTVIEGDEPGSTPRQPLTTPALPTNPPLPTLPPTATPPPPATVIAVGSLSDCAGRGREVADLVASTEGTVIAVGDLTSDGSTAKVEECFLPLYGDELDRMFAVPGNNDLAIDAGGPFYDLVARTPTDSTAGKGWFVTSIGAWQIIGLNSRCADVGGCSEGSEQYQWLDNLLRERPAECRAVFWHDARFTSSAEIEPAADLGPMYGRLHAAGADVIVSAGPANYERMGPLQPNGDPNEEGVMNFNVGTGGADSDQFGEGRPGSRYRSSEHVGVLELVLSANSYTWEFVATPGAVERAGSSVDDAGSGTC